MALETGTFVSDLVTSNPVGSTDAKSQGDDHLRLIKSVLKTTFPDASRAFRFEKTLAKAIDYTTVLADDRTLILVDASGAARTMTLLAVATAKDGHVLAFKKTDSGANAVTIDGAGAETIDGATTLVLSNEFDTALLYCDGSAWHVLVLKTPAGVASTRLISTGVGLSGGGDLSADRTHALDIAGLTAETAPAVGDEVPLEDVSATARRKMTLTNLLKIVNALTAETAPATDDELLLYDLSATAADKITLANLLKVVNALAEDTAVQSASDFVLTYDTSASAVKKAKPDNLGIGGGLTSIANTALTAITNLDFTGFASGTYDNYKIILSNVRPASDSTLEMETSTDGGTSFDVGASDYSWGVSRLQESGSRFDSGDGDDSEINLTAGSSTGSAANEHLSGEITIYRPEDAEFTHFTWEINYRGTSTQLFQVTGSGGRQSAADVDAVRFHWATADFVALGSGQHLGIAQ